MDSHTDTIQLRINSNTRAISTAATVSSDQPLGRRDRRRKWHLPSTQNGRLPDVIICFSHELKAQVPGRWTMHHSDPWPLFSWKQSMDDNNFKGPDLNQRHRYLPLCHLLLHLPYNPELKLSQGYRHSNIRFFILELNKLDAVIHFGQNSWIVFKCRLQWLFRMLANRERTEPMSSHHLHFSTSSTAERQATVQWTASPKTPPMRCILHPHYPSWLWFTSVNKAHKS